MTMVFQRIETQGIAQLSYLIGDDSSGTAAVIDPRPQVDVYMQMAREYSLAITHVFETHIHADFMSGARELVNRLGTAKLYASGEGDAHYDFKEVNKIHDGASFEFGSVILTAIHTPGHTPEHMAYLAAEKENRSNPWGVFTGDALFVGSAGRPDLLDDDETEELEERLFHTLRETFLNLDDGVLVYPCHGSGSACGGSIGDRPMSTIGFERRTNPYLQINELEEFRKFVRDNAPPEPHHYRRLKKTNAAGASLLRGGPVIPALPPGEFKKAIDKKKATLLDTRQMLAFGGGHIPGAINIGPRPELSVWAGQMLDADKPILLIVEDETSLLTIAWWLVNTGFTKFAGYLVGGMKAWDNAGYPMQRLSQITVHELKDDLETMQILDVRSPSEWEEGHIPNARHQFVAKFHESKNGVDGMDKQRPIAVYCDSGYRADLASSILQARGFADVRNVVGSWQAWTNSDYPVEK